MNRLIPSRIALGAARECFVEPEAEQAPGFSMSRASSRKTASRSFAACFWAIIGLAALAAPSLAQGSKPAAAKPPAAAGAAKAPPGQPVQLDRFDDWGAYASDTAKGKVCYALAPPKERLPKTLKRDDGYIFIATRPAENVRNEVSFILGFPVKEGGEGLATVGTAKFSLVTKGGVAWVKNAAEDAAFLEAMRKAQSLTVSVQSKRGNASTDRYSLAGAAKALERVRKECP